MPIGLRDVAPFVTQAPPPEAMFAPLQQAARVMMQNREMAQNQQQFDAQQHGLNARAAADLAAASERLQAGFREDRRTQMLGALQQVIGAALKGDRAALEAAAPLLRAHGVGMRQRMAPEAPALPGQEVSAPPPPATLDMPGMTITPSAAQAPAPKMAPTGGYDFFTGDEELGGFDVNHLSDLQRQAVQPALDALYAGSSKMDKAATGQARDAVLANPQLIAQGGPAAMEAMQGIYGPRVSEEHSDERARNSAIALAGRTAQSGESKESDRAWERAQDYIRNNKIVERREGYVTYQDALNQLDKAGQNGTTWINIVYALAKAREPGGRLSDKDIGMAEGLKSVLDRVENFSSVSFDGAAGEALRKQVREAILTSMSTNLDSLQRAHDGFTNLRDSLGTDPEAFRVYNGSISSEFYGIPLKARPGRAPRGNPKPAAPAGGGGGSLRVSGSGKDAAPVADAVKASLTSPAAGSFEEQLKKDLGL